MGLTVAQKILQSHIRQEDFPSLTSLQDSAIEPGTPIAITIDQTLTQDATGTMAYLQFETIGIPRVKTEVSVSYIDHNTLQTDFKNMDDHQYLQSIAAKYGLWFSRPGNGICHQVHLEKFGKPGKTLLGSDSHTPTCGGLGMIAIGAGGLDVAVAMGGGSFHLVMPKIIGVRITGTLKKGSSAKDIILDVLRQETVKGGVSAIYEYFGEGIASLSVPQRATITNMGAELGATCSIFPSDENTKSFLEHMGRGDDWTELKADANAHYHKIIEVNLDTLDSLAACPHSPDAIKKISELEGKKVDQVVIGSCTNSSIDDLAAVANIVKGKHIAPHVEAGIAPGSRATLLLAEKSGILGELIRAGFRILESACGPCIGQGFAPSSKAVSLRTFNRNFKGRSGSSEAEVYLVSPETAASAAITGCITNPSNFLENRVENSSFAASTNLNFEDITTVTSDNGMLIAPLSQKDSENVEIIRGPNIKPCPKAPEMKDILELPLILKAGDNVSTDDILPAGAKMLPLRSNIPEISKFTLERLDEDFYKNAISVLEQGEDGCIIVGGENYGQGSSREHAALAPMFLGVRVVLAKSFARIHKANLVNYGIIPIEFVNSDDYDSVTKGDTIVIQNIKEALLTGENFKICFNDKIIEGLNDFSERSRKIIQAGGLTAYTKTGA